MLISHIKSADDLRGRKTLQQQLLDVEVANEAELEKRVKDYKNPNKPIAVAPEYKTNAELQKDRLAQEKQAIVNMSELGFDYNKSAELVAWLSSSLINKLVEFNANFRGIKKELTETTNPKLLNLDYLKNYLEKYFEDLDVNYGRKFSGVAQNGMSATSTIDDLTELLPSPALVDELRDRMYGLSTTIRETIAGERGLSGALVEVRQAIAETELSKADVRALPERDRRAYKERMDDLIIRRESLISDIKEGSEIASKLRMCIILLDLYKVIIPSDETFMLLKTSLTQQERADLIRRYIQVLKNLHILSRSGTAELLDEAQSVNPEDTQGLTRLANKCIKSLAFVSNDSGVNQISKLQRDYEIVLQQSGKIGELDKITRLNEIREQEIQRARAVLGNFHRDIDEDMFYADNARDALREVNIRKSDARDIGNRLETTLAEELELQDEAVKELGRDKAEALLEQRRFNQSKEYVEGRRGLNPIGLPVEKSGRQIADEQKAFEAQALANYKEQAKGYYRNFVGEIDARFNESNKGGVDMLEKFLFDPASAHSIGLPRRDKPVRANKTALGYYGELKQILGQWLIANRINTLTLDTMFNEPTIKPYYYKTDGSRYNDNRETIGGVGLASKLRKHFKKDEKELREIKKAFKKHQQADDSSSESEDEKKGEGALGFKHRRVKVGKGIAVKETPSYKTFGKYVIHMGHLLDKNVANFKYPSLGSIPSIKPLTISEDYKEFLIDTLENGKPNDRILSKLPTEEQKHFERVVAGAGLIDTFKLKRNVSEDDKKEANRFNLLRGEVLAGNNNEKVLKELRALIVKFINEGRIHQKEGTNMLMELSVM